MWGTHMKKRSTFLGKPRAEAKGSWSQGSRTLSPTRSPACIPRAGGPHGQSPGPGVGPPGVGGHRAVWWAGPPGTVGMCPGEALGCLQLLEGDTVNICYRWNFGEFRRPCAQPPRSLQKETHSKCS